MNKRIVFEIPDPELKPKAKLLKEHKSKEGLVAYSPRRQGGYPRINCSAWARPKPKLWPKAEH